MRQLSEWLVALDSDGHITKAALTLGFVPRGETHITHIKTDNKDTFVHWYGRVPSEELENLIDVIIADWLADGRLG